MQTHTVLNLLGTTCMVSIIVGCGQPPEVAKPFNSNVKEVRTIKGHQYYLPKDADRNIAPIIGNIDKNNAKKNKVRSFYKVANCKEGDAFWVSKQAVKASEKEHTQARKLDVFANAVLRGEGGCVSPVGGYK